MDDFSLLGGVVHRMTDVPFVAFVLPNVRAGPRLESTGAGPTTARCHRRSERVSTGSHKGVSLVKGLGRTVLTLHLHCEDELLCSDLKELSTLESAHAFQLSCLDGDGLAFNGVSAGARRG
jgi:hypothetical protein